MNARKLVTDLSISILAILLSGIVVSAQTVGASIQGTVTDANGSALPNATVEVRNVATGVAHNVAADAEFNSGSSSRFEQLLIIELQAPLFTKIA
jgi:hypothetical protein